MNMELNISQEVIDLAIIVLNYNRPIDTNRCVESLLVANFSPHQIWVVDNGSCSDEYNNLRILLKDKCNIIRLDQNLGYAGGMNSAIRYLKKYSPNWYLLMNNDTYVERNICAQLYSIIRSDNTYDILAPVILYDSEPNKIWFFGSKLISRTLITIQLYKNKVYTKEYPSVVQVDFVSGCGILIRKNVFNSIGLFNENYFLYGEDVDFCWRALKAGHKVGVVTRAVMWHKISASTSHNKYKAVFLKTMNQNYFYRANSSGALRVLMFIFSIYKLFRDIFSEIGEKKVHCQISPYVQGWINGWFR